MAELVPGDRGEKRLAGERPKDDGLGRGHGCRPRHVQDQRELPEDVVGAELAEDLAVAADGRVSLLDHVDEVAGVALPDDLVARPGATLAQRRRQPPQRRVRQRREDGRPPEKLELRHVDLGLVVDPPQAPARERREPDEEASRHDQRTPCAEQVDREWREQRAGAHGRDHDELEQAEDASDHALVCVLLHDREPRDVEKAVRKARQREAQDGHPRLGPGGEQDERQSPPGE